jgi:hypothetical protein
MCRGVLCVGIGKIKNKNIFLKKIKIKLYFIMKNDIFELKTRKLIREYLFY